MTFATTMRAGNNHQMVLWMGFSICKVTGEGVCVCVCVMSGSQDANKKLEAFIIGCTAVFFWLRQAGTEKVEQLHSCLHHR